MLDSLHIENIAVIERADIEFTDGLCVLTGETGAGKSMLIDSINAVLGERTSKELIRTGCEKASVSAVFSGLTRSLCDKLAEMGFECDGELLVSRIITDKKSSVRLNGQNATAAMVRELAPLLVNIHGQHDSQALLDPDKHYLYIDLLAKNADALTEYQAAFSAMQSTRRRIKELTASLEGSQARADMLKFQIAELEQAQIKIGEQKSLMARQQLMSVSQQAAQALDAAIYSLAGDSNAEAGEFGGAMDLVNSASAELSSVEGEEFSEINGLLIQANDNLEQARDAAQTLLERLNYDEKEAELVEQRLDTYYRLSHKYGASEEEMLDFLENARNELKKVEISDDEIVLLNSSLAQQVETLKRCGAALTARRRAAAEQFGKSVVEQLRFLNMPSVRFCAQVNDAAYSRLGANKVEFLISTNPGEPLKPLAKIASGGEMSRIMLAIKNVLAEDDPVGTLIFDEIDAGISGSAAAKVGIKLRETAAKRQIICVTHLAQIAAAANSHYLIEKKSDGERAVTNISALDSDGRRTELARIIGSSTSENALKTAGEMLDSFN